MVTAFVRRQERVLTVRRSDRVSSYRGKWAGISGYVGSGELPDDAALREVWEETGLFTRLLCGGLPLDVDDAETDRAWRVHPFLVAASADSEPRLDWEAAESRWVLPEELAALDTVPGLSEALARVWDPVAALPEPLRTAARALREDHVRGAAELAPQAWALAAQSPQHAELVAALRPTMAPVVAAARAAGRGQPFRPRIEQAVAAAVAVLRPALRVVTLSRSSTILAALARTPGPLHLTVAESQPGGEGRATAELAARAGHRVELVLDAAAPFRVRTADLVLTGADAVTRTGDVVNKAGTYALALAARDARVPFYVVCDDSKLWDDDVPPPLEAHFDLTPAALVTAILQ